VTSNSNGSLSLQFANAAPSANAPIARVNVAVIAPRKIANAVRIASANLLVSAKLPAHAAKLKSANVVLNASAIHANASVAVTAPRKIANAVRIASAKLLVSAKLPAHAAKVLINC